MPPNLSLGFATVRVKVSIGFDALPEAFISSCREWIKSGAFAVKLPLPIPNVFERVDRRCLEAQHCICKGTWTRSSAAEWGGAGARLDGTGCCRLEGEDAQAQKVGHCSVDSSQ